MITPASPCSINGVVTQDDPTYREGDRGFVEPIPIQFDPRFGIAWAPIHARSFAQRRGFITTGRRATRLKAGRLTDSAGYAIHRPNSYLGGTSAVSPVGVSGIDRVGHKRPSIHKYTVGIERELGWSVVANVAYVGEFTRYLNDNFNHNAIPAGARFDPANRDETQTPSPSNPRALPTCSCARSSVSVTSISVHQSTRRATTRCRCS